MAIDTPGCYIVLESDYHADPCPTPSLSSSIARILIQDSPLHAFAAHPRLSERPTVKEASHLDAGSICHALMLEGEDRAVVIEADNYRTKAAQEARDAARLAGKYPILAHEMSDVNEMMAACRYQLDRHKDASDAFKEGQAEMTLCWQEENGIWCRARPDWMVEGRARMYDYKTSGRSARPSYISRIAASIGWAMQASFYIRGFKAVFGRELEPEFRFVAQENFRPYALSVLELSPADLALADAQIEVAVETFGRCLDTGIWPGYSDKVERITSPAYIEAAWMEEQV